MTDTVNVPRDAVVAALKEADRPFRQTLSDYRYQILTEAALAAAPKAEPAARSSEYRPEREDYLNPAIGRHPEAPKVEPALCVSCEGKPAPENDPCRSCGASSPKVEQEPTRIVERARAWLDKQGVQTLYDDHPAVLINGLLRYIVTNHPAPASDELLEAAVGLRAAQRSYMADRGNEALGNAVGVAAERLDVAIAKHKGPQS